MGAASARVSNRHDDAAAEYEGEDEEQMETEPQVCFKINQSVIINQSICHYIRQPSTIRQPKSVSQIYLLRTSCGFLSLCTIIS